MKRIFLLFLVAFFFNQVFCQTAVNFNCTDCSGFNHDLFSELNAGKVVVISWVMPCVACIAPASTAANTVAAMGNSNVVFYLCDDYANTNCGTLNSWATTNSIVSSAVFSNAAIDMTDYGAPGMPKTVVIGGGDCHSVFYNQNETISATDLQTAINAALLPCTVKSDLKPGKTTMVLYPNPVRNMLNVLFSVEFPGDVVLEIVNLQGAVQRQFALQNLSSGIQNYSMNVELIPAGIYFASFSFSGKREISMFTILH